MGRFGVAIATLMLCACGSQGGDNQAAGSEASKSGGGAASLQPGQWEVTTQVLSMTAPGMPAGASPPTPPPTTVRHCLTPEQAAAPGADFVSGSGQGGGCRSENMRFAGGRISGTVQCDAQGSTMRADLSGQFTPTSYELTQTVQANAQGMTVNMESRTTGRRIGDCS